MSKLILLTSVLFLFGCISNINTFEDNFISIDSLSLDREVLKNIPFTSFHKSIFNNKDIFTFKKDDNIFGYDFELDTTVICFSLNNLDSMTTRDFLFHNIDSIFICSIHKRTSEMFISLMNSNQEITRSWNLTNKSKKIPDTYFYIDSRYSHPMILLKNKLYFQATYRIKPGTVLESNIPIEMILDLSNDSTTQFGDLPPEYKTGKFYGNHQYEYSRTINDKSQFVFSYPITDKLYIYSLNGELIKVVKCKSLYIDTIEPLSKKDYFELSAKMDAYVYKAQYNEIIYDNFNDRYIRLVAHNLNKYNKDGSLNKWYNRRWSLILLDNNLTQINEFLLPENKFSNHIIFTTKGLMMRSIEPDNLYKCYTFKLIQYV